MLSETSKLQFIIEDETRNYEIFDVMNINLNNLDVFLEFTAFISDLINRGLDKMGEITSNDDKLMTLVTCDICKNGFWWINSKFMKS